MRQRGVSLAGLLVLVCIPVAPSGAAPLVVGKVNVYDVRVEGFLTGGDAGGGTRSATLTWAETYTALRVKVTPSRGYARVKPSYRLEGLRRGDAVFTMNFRDTNPAMPCVWTQTYREPRLLRVQSFPGLVYRLGLRFGPDENAPYPPQPNRDTCDYQLPHALTGGVQGPTGWRTTGTSSSTGSSFRPKKAYDRSDVLFNRLVSGAAFTIVLKGPYTGGEPHTGSASVRITFKPRKP